MGDHATCVFLSVSVRNEEREKGVSNFDRMFSPTEDGMKPLQS